MDEVGWKKSWRGTWREVSFRYYGSSAYVTAKVVPRGHNLHPTDAERDRSASDKVDDRRHDHKITIL